MRLPWLLTALLLAGGAFLYLKPEYRAWLTEAVSHDLKPASTSRFYKWRNERGEWQLSDVPPPAGVSYEVLEHRLDENVLPRPPQLQDQAP